MSTHHYDRLFIAVEPQLDVVENYRLVQRDLIKFIAERKAVMTPMPAELCHITLKYIGSLHEDNFQLLIDLLDDVASRNKAFKIKNGGVGAFPSSSKPRIIYIDTLEGQKHIHALVDDIENSLSPYQVFERERRPYKAHMTLGRIRTPDCSIDLADVTAALTDVSIGSSYIDELVLFHSVLNNKGPKYDVLYRARLRG